MAMHDFEILSPGSKKQTLKREITTFEPSPGLGGNVCLEGHEGTACSGCKIGYSRYLQLGLVQAFRRES